MPYVTHVQVPWERTCGEDREEEKAPWDAVANASPLPAGCMENGKETTSSSVAWNACLLFCYLVRLHIAAQKMNWRKLLSSGN
ncbi:MAG TPA: hypothetical protein VGP89_00415, partial [Candidatus Angelobacter sp.]|nr:hypothetical protein [Candidatus Angelobacter sp.]